MSLLRMISSPYNVLRNLMDFCHNTLHFGNSIHEVSGSAIKLFTFEIRWAERSVWENVEGLYRFLPVLRIKTGKFVLEIT